jgi:lysosomal alpha-mannosidase
MWWDEQTNETRANYEQMVKEGRLEFIGGGWSMNDEAAAHYTAIVDNMSWGWK